MKLHLPKQLFSALLAVFTMAAAEAAWSGNTFFTNGDVADEIQTSKGTVNNDLPGVLFLKPASGSSGEVTVSDLTLNNAGKTLVITGDWNASPNFTNLVIDQLDVEVTNTSLEIGERQKVNKEQTVTINTIGGSETLTSLTVTQYGNLTIGKAGTLNTITNAGTLTLGSAVTVSGDIANTGTLTLGGTVTGEGEGIQISGGSVNVQINNDSILHYEGEFTFASANGSDLTGKKHGFLRGVQKLTILNNVTMGGDTAVNISGYTGGAYSGGVYTVDIESEKTAFHVGDTWTYDSAVSKGATSFHVGPQGVLEFASPTSTMPVPISNFGQVVINAANGGVLDTLAKDITNINSGLVTINNGGTITQAEDFTVTGIFTMNGGTYTNGVTCDSENSYNDTNAKKLSGGLSATLVLNDVEAEIGGTKTIATNIIVGDKTTLKIVTNDNLDYSTAFNLKVLTGGTVDLGSTRQSLSKNNIVELAGGSIVGKGGKYGTSGDTTYGLDFYDGGTIIVSENSVLNTAVGGHNSGTINIEVTDGKILTFEGEYAHLSGTQTINKTGNGTVLYKGLAFRNNLTITAGIFEYYLDNKDSSTHSTTIGGGGTFKKSGNGTMLANMDGFQGYIIIEGGTLQATQKATSDNSPKSITVTNATFDINGKAIYSELTLNADATLANNTTADPGDSERQLHSITLGGNATVHVQHDGSLIRMIASGHGDAALALNNHTLKKTGSGKFDMQNVQVSSAGTIEIDEGTVVARVHNNRSQDLSKLSLKVNTGGTFELKSSDQNITDLTINGGTVKVESKKTLTATGTTQVTSAGGSMSGNLAATDKVKFEQGALLKLGSGSSLKVNSSTEPTKTVTITGETMQSATQAGGSLAYIQEGTTFSIADMTLTNVNINAGGLENRVNLSNVSGNATLEDGTFGLAMVGMKSENDNGSLTYTVEGTPTLTLNSNASRNKVLLVADPTIDIAGDWGIYNLSFTLNLTVEGDEELDNTGWLELVGFDGMLNEMLQEQNATLAGTSQLLRSNVVSTPTVGYAYTETNNVGSLVVTITGLSIPEPTTATLSLLALAGLAARRRRK